MEDGLVISFSNYALSRAGDARNLQTFYTKAQKAPTRQRFMQSAFLNVTALNRKTPPPLCKLRLHQAHVYEEQPHQPQSSRQLQRCLSH
jgi:hypothetical protein